MSVPMLVISGSMGSGKTTVLSELSDLLEEAGVAHAAVDLDTLSLMHPRRGEQGERLMYDNLAAMWPNFAAGGRAAGRRLRAGGQGGPEVLSRGRTRRRAYRLPLGSPRRDDAAAGPQPGHRDAARAVAGQLVAAGRDVA